MPTELYREVTMLYEKKGRYIVEFPDILTKRQHHIEIEVDERRMNNKEVELGFDEERALKEAKRCLSCRRCLGCALCWAECKPEAIMFDMQDEILDPVFRVDLSPEIDIGLQGGGAGKVGDCGLLPGRGGGGCGLQLLARRQRCRR